MRSKWIIAVVMFAAVLLQVGCGTSSTNVPGQCPTCGTTVNGAYGVIDIVPVPEHNPTGEPGGPFNSFDISVTDSAHRRFYVSDRIGLDIPVFDMDQFQALYVISGQNGVAAGGFFADACNPIIPPIVTVLGNFTRYGCRNDVPGAVFTWTSAKPAGFGASGLFGGFPGAQCCAARANGVNPLSGPDGEVLSPDGKVLFGANGSSSVVAFDVTCGGKGCTLQSTPPVMATIPTGASPDYDGCSPILNVGCLPGSTQNTAGINPCIASANGRAFSDPTCGDLRADEMSIGVINGHTILLVANGDPGLPFVTLVDVSEVLTQSGAVGDALGGPICAPGNNPVEPYFPATGAGPFPAGNFPKCIVGQIYYDASPANNLNTPIDGGPAPCPDPSTGAPATGVSGPGGGNTASCHHGPMLNPNGSYCANQAAPPASCFGAASFAGLGGSAFNPNTGHFLLTNANASPTDLTVGTVDEIDPRLGNPNGPVVINSFPMPNCMPTSIVQGPGNQFLVGCGDHDGETFPPNEYVINGTTGQIIKTIDQVGGVDEIWYNPTDNRYYVAARDMPNGPVMGVIDAATNLWLVNVGTGANSHSISVDSLTNHVWVPLQAGGRCGNISSNGCIGVYAQQ